MTNPFAHVALLVVSLLYGANYLIAKGVMPVWINPPAFIALRVGGALFLFGVLAFILREKINRKDYLRFLLCGLTGVAINQMCFFEGLSRTSAMNSAILMTINPIMVLIMARIFLREPLSGIKIIGIILGAGGATGIISMSNLYGDGGGDLTGDIFILVNALSYAIYLVSVKPLMRKYKPITVANWVFFAGAIFVFPYSLNHVAATDFSAIPNSIWYSVAYVVICTTFLAYLLNVFALQRVSPSVVSVYIYLQPLAALLFALILPGGQAEIRSLSWEHAVFAALIFAGVYLVSVKRRKTQA